MAARRVRPVETSSKHEPSLTSGMIVMIDDDDDDDNSGGDGTL